MCNEFRFEETLHALMDTFRQLKIPLDFEGAAPNLEPRASIRPTDPAPVVVGQDGGALLRQLRWGFPGPRGPVINFRSEDRRFGRGRCIVPMDGFYEFTGTTKPKSKWLFTPIDGPLLGVAGLIRDDRFTLLTCAPGLDVAPYHDRQIAILPKSEWAAWLDTAQPQPMLGPAPEGTLRVAQIR